MLAAILLFALSCFAGDSGERAFIRKSFRNLTPEAQARLKEYARAGRDWKARSPRPSMFVRGQFFYGLERDGYLHAWYERPLHQDTSFQDASERGHGINPASWRRNVEIARKMKLAGFAFFPSNPGCWDVLSRSQLSGGEITILPELHNGDVAKGVEHCLGVLERLRKEAPNCYRLDDRVVVTCYPPMVPPHHRPQLEFWRRLKAAARERFGGDHFAFMPYAYIFDAPDLDRPHGDLQLIEHAEANLREILRGVDGLFYLLAESDWAPAAHLREPHDTVVAPIVKKVLSETEFGNKYLGIGYWQAHENCYRRFADKPSHGFTRLVSALESIDRMRPDFAIGFEWDEENENTHFRPTVSNGQTTQRLLRHYADRWAGIGPTAYPDDVDRESPNLAVAYRKSLEAGEALTAQVINIPDGTAPDAELKVSWRWLTPSGRCVREFPAQKLATAELRQIEFTCPSEALVGEHLLIPELRVEGERLGARSYSAGFWPLALEANRNLDSKWVRIALRELCPGVTASLEVSEPAPDGTRRVTGEISGAEDFRSIEVLEGSDTIYMCDPKAPAERPDGERVALSVNFLSQPTFWRLHAATGLVRTLNAPHAVHTDLRPHFVRRTGADCAFANRPSRFNFQNQHWIEIPRDEVESAIVELHIPDAMPAKRIPVRELLRDDVYSWGLDGGGQVVVRRELTVRTIPRPVMKPHARFAFAFKPRNPLSVLRLQAIDRNFRLWRGCGRDFVRSLGREQTYHVYSEVARTGTAVRVDASRLVSLKYDFSDARGDAWFPRGARRDLPCAGGGGVGAITGLGTGDNNGYGYALNHVFGDLREKDGTAITVPRRVREPDGTWSLRFSGHAFASLPLGFNPRQSGFEISMRIWPEDLVRFQGILDSGNVGLRLVMEQGVPRAFVCLSPEMSRRGVNDTAGLAVSGPRLKPCEWNTLRLVFDQERAFLEVNGVAGAPAYGCGNANNSACMGLGIFVSTLQSFHGRIAELTMSPR